jgi:histidinol dehydrogenase
VTMLRITDDKTFASRQPTADTVYPAALLGRLGELFGEALSPAEAVTHILSDVRRRGDSAVKEWTHRIDGVQVADPRMASSPGNDPVLLDALRQAADRVRLFHAQQPILSWKTSDGTLGQRMTPLRRVGVYVPGGSAPLPSSLLMSVIPAQVAGVKDIVVCTPPGKGEGSIHASILAAAHICGIEYVYCVGGAQAIAAMTFGTQSVPKVDKIVGPGNLFVTLAKQQVFGLVGLDGLAGPTETVIVADDTANPAWVAADLLAQAEHDPLATALLLTPSRRLAEAVQHEVGRQMEALSRADIIAQSFENTGAIVITEDVGEAVRLANEFAPEHMCLAVENAADWAE